MPSNQSLNSLKVSHRRHLVRHLGPTGGLVELVWANRSIHIGYLDLSNEPLFKLDKFIDDLNSVDSKLVTRALIFLNDMQTEVLKVSTQDKPRLIQFVEAVAQEFGFATVFELIKKCGPTKATTIPPAKVGNFKYCLKLSKFNPGDTVYCTQPAGDVKYGEILHLDAQGNAITPRGEFVDAKAYDKVQGGFTLVTNNRVYAPHKCDDTKAYICVREDTKQFGFLKGAKYSGTRVKGCRRNSLARFVEAPSVPVPAQGGVNMAVIPQGNYLNVPGFKKTNDSAGGYTYDLKKLPIGTVLLVTDTSAGACTSRIWTEGKQYTVEAHGLNNAPAILDEEGDYRRHEIHTHALFEILSMPSEDAGDINYALPASSDEHDSWGIGRTYKAPKKEWEPDVPDPSVDLMKSIRDASLGN